MKKSILLMAGAFFAITASAQMQKVSQVNVSLQKKDATLMKAEMKQGPRKDLASGVYYTRPEGTLYWGMDEQGRYYDVARLCTPCFTDLKFTNMCNQSAAAKWSFGQADGSDLADANNDLIVPITADQGYYMPTITVGANSYKIGEKTGNPDNSILLTDTITYHSFVDQVSSKTYGWGSMDTGYLFGTGSFNPTQGDYAGHSFKSQGFVMTVPKPISPLYIEYFTFLINSDSDNPIADGKQVTMQIRNVEERELEDGRVITEPGARIIAELTATKADLSEPLVEGQAVQYTKTGLAWIYSLKFSNKTTDAFDNVVDEPVIINEPCFIVVTGHDQEGVNFGYRINDQPDEDAIVYGSYALSYEEGSDMNYSAWYGEKAVIEMSFYGGYDYCEVLNSSELVDESGNPTGETVENINTLRVSADGSTVENEGFEGLQGKVIMNSAFPWLDGATDDENYLSEEMPEWITLSGESDFGNYSDGSQYYTGTTYVSIACEALPAGETGRAATIYLEGKGYKSAYPIIVLQGDATIEDAIENVVTVNVNKSNNTYNVAGQKVGKNFKGIVIKDGKKMLVK